MGFLPGWDSADTTATIAHNLHITAIVVLGLLFVSEGLALMYDSRKEHLAGVAALNAENQRKSDVAAAEDRRKAETQALQERLSEADKRVAEARQAAADAAKKASKVEAQQADRRLSEEQKQVIKAAISPYPGQKVRLESLHGDSESYRYAQEFGNIFQAANWEIFGGGVAQVTYTGGVPEGAEVMISAAHGAAGTAPIGAGNLMIALISLGLIKEGHSDPSVLGDVVLVRIGRKRPP